MSWISLHSNNKMREEGRRSPWIRCNLVKFQLKNYLFGSWLWCSFSGVAGFKVSQPPRCLLGFIFRFRFSVFSPAQIKTLLRFFFQHKFFPCRVRSSAGPASLGLSLLAGRSFMCLVCAEWLCHPRAAGAALTDSAPTSLCAGSGPFFVLVSRAGYILRFLLPVFDSAQVSKQFDLIPRG
jgi:hypothetical protein